MTDIYDITPLFIDKISFTYDIAPEERQGLIDTIRDTQHSDDITLHSLWSDYRGMKYRWNWKLIIPDTGNRSCLIQAEPRRDTDNFLRVEWNPHKAALAGNRYVWENLEIMLGDNFPGLLDSAMVTRLDLAVDVSPITPDLLWPTDRRLRKAKQQFNDLGELINIKLGSERGNRHISIYNRNDEPEPGEDRYEETEDPLTTRFEVRLRPHCSFRELQSIANPFQNLVVFRASNEDPANLDNWHRWFLDSVRLHNSPHPVLRGIRRYETRRDYEDFLYEHFNFERWRTQGIWEGYPDALGSCCYPVSNASTSNPDETAKETLTLSASGEKQLYKTSTVEIQQVTSISGCSSLPLVLPRQVTRITYLFTASLTKLAARFQWSGQDL